VDVLVGRQYGSEGKGNIAGHIAPEYNLLLGAGAGGHVRPTTAVLHGSKYSIMDVTRRTAKAGSGSILRCPADPLRLDVATA